MVECTCRAANPNCFKCGGWGVIDDVIGKKRASERKTTVNNNVNNLTKCHLCNAMVKPNRLGKHLKKFIKTCFDSPVGWANGFIVWPRGKKPTDIRMPDMV